MTIHTGYPGANRDVERDWNQHKIETQKNKVPKSLYEINSYLFHVYLCLLSNDFSCIIGDGRVTIKTRYPVANRDEEGDTDHHKIEKKIRYPNLYMKLTLIYSLFTYAFYRMILNLLFVLRYPKKYGIQIFIRN